MHLSIDGTEDRETGTRPLFIRPHRAYRRPRALPSRALWLSLLGLAVLETAVLAFLSDIARLFVGIARAFAPGRPALAQDEFLSLVLRPIDISVRPLDDRALLVWSVASVLGVFVLVKARSLGGAVRFIGTYNLLMVGATASYLLYAGRLGYNGASFSALYLETAIVILVALPVFVGLLSLSIPFSMPERFGLIAACFLYDFAFSAIRYALFAWALRGLGAVVMPNLYLFLGPLLDFVYIVGVFSVFLVRRSKRLDTPDPSGHWSWL